MALPRDSSPERIGRPVGRFEMYGPIASGGFATVHLGRSIGAAGFSKLVAIKKLHSQYASDPEVTKMFLDEARVVARIQHTNVVPTLDFVEEDGELFMVMEYVEGVTLGHLLSDLGKQRRKIPFDIVLRVITGALQGLHAAHEARDERGQLLSVIHRDVSPDNILIGVDGHARLLDFGVARALGRYHATRDGEIKGKLYYMTPEQVAGKPLSRSTDIFAASVVMWQCLTGKRLFDGEHLGELAVKVTHQEIEPPSRYNRAIPTSCDAIVMRGLERDPAKRWPTAEEMADALEAVGKVATPGRVGRWLKMHAKERLEARAAAVAAVELTPAEASSPGESHASEGENSFRAAAEVVVRLPGAAQTEQGTDVVAMAALQRETSGPFRETPSSPGSRAPGEGRPPVSGERPIGAEDVTPVPLSRRMAQAAADHDEEDVPTVQLAAHMKRRDSTLPPDQRAAPPVEEPVAPAPLPIAAKPVDLLEEQQLLAQQARTNEAAIAAASRRRRVTAAIALAAAALVAVTIYAAVSIGPEPPTATTAPPPVAAPTVTAPATVVDTAEPEPVPAAEPEPEPDAEPEDSAALPATSASAAPAQPVARARPPAPLPKPAQALPPPRPAPKPKPKGENALFSRD